MQLGLISIPRNIPFWDYFVKSWGCLKIFKTDLLLILREDQGPTLEQLAEEYSDVGRFRSGDSLAGV